MILKNYFKDNKLLMCFKTLVILVFSQQLLAIDNTKIMGPDECAECHDVESSLWENTHHFSTFETMPEQDEALEIAEKLGIDDVVESKICQSCHLTLQKVDDEAEVIAGVSCESCHGAAADWMDIHSEEDKPQQESKAIWAKAETHGMIRPNNLSRLAGNCLDCHLVKNQELVNKGGHIAGSEFNLVTWSQGEVRHNTFHSEDGENRPASKAKLRKMLVIGSVLELQRSLIAYAEATDKTSNYAKSMKQRIEKTKNEIKTIANSKVSPTFDQVLTVASRPLSDSQEFAGINAQELLSLVKKLEQEDSNQWQALDNALSKLGPSKGEAQ